MVEKLLDGLKHVAHPTKRSVVVNIIPRLTDPSELGLKSIFREALAPREKRAEHVPVLGDYICDVRHLALISEVIAALAKSGGD